MPKDLLTELKVRAAKPESRSYKLSDGGGLFLLVKQMAASSGAGSTALMARRNLYAIGPYPDVGLSDARTERDSARQLVKQGIHPSHDRQEIKRRNIETLEERKRAMESSFAKVSAAYLAEVKASYKPGSYRAKESRIRKYLAPKLAEIPNQ
ncbi:Arm DNA-binding domain-containing protein [Halopseudomonas pachastrellae]|nr:Arm DNA-binding domain-containing protein [Halopseudomonas pachastrellae]